MDNDVQFPTYGDEGVPAEVLAEQAAEHAAPELLDLSDQPRAMSLGVDSAGGYAVPYQLDGHKKKRPTITT